MAIKTALIAVCDSCGHEWLSDKYSMKNGDIPIVCAKCKTPYWNKGGSKRK